MNFRFLAAYLLFLALWTGLGTAGLTAAAMLTGQGDPLEIAQFAALACGGFGLVAAIPIGRAVAGIGPPGMPFRPLPLAPLLARMLVAAVLVGGGLGSLGLLIVYGVAPYYPPVQLLPGLGGMLGCLLGAHWAYSTTPVPITSDLP